MTPDPTPQEPRLSRRGQIMDRLWCFGMAYITGIGAFAAFTAWENPWLGVFVALGSVSWLMSANNHGGVR